MSLFDDEPDINRKGTLHGLVTKAMLANRVRSGVKQPLPPIGSGPPPNGSEKKDDAMSSARDTDLPSPNDPNVQSGVSPNKTSLESPSPATNNLQNQSSTGGFLNPPGWGKGNNNSNSLMSPSGSQLLAVPSTGGKGSRRHSGGDTGADKDAMKKKKEDITSELSTEPLPLQYVVQNLETRVQATGLYKDFILFLPFIVLFFIFYLNGREIEANHMMSAAVKTPLLRSPFPSLERNVETAQNWPVDGGSILLPQDRTFFEVISASQFAVWFADVVVRSTWDCAEPDAPRTPLRRTGQLTALGAMRMRIQSMASKSCIWNERFTSAISAGYPCFNTFSSSLLEMQDVCNVVNPAATGELLWRFVPTSFLSTSQTLGKIGIYPSGGYTANLLFNTSCNDALRFAKLLEDPGPCAIVSDAATRFIAAEWFLYNPSTDTYLGIKLTFEVSEGGGWLPSYQFRPFPVWSVSRLGQTAFDIFFLVFVLYYWFEFIRGLMAYNARYKKILPYLLDYWNFFELVNLSTFLAVCILRFLWWSKSVQNKISLPFNEGYPEGLDPISLFYSYQIYANAVNAVFTMLKILKYMRLNNRMNILTRTLDVCTESIAGVLLLFVFILVAYAICGTALYGTSISTFRSVDASFAQLLFMLFGDFPYNDMRRVQPVLTGFYLFSYIILAQFILLNFIIAILSDGFAQVSQNTAIEPLDQVVLRQITTLKFTLHPRNLKSWLLLFLKGRSRNDLLYEMNKYLQEHMDLIELMSPELLDNDLPITKDDLDNWLPEQLHEDLGNFFIAVLWDDLVHDYHIDSQSEEYQQAKEIEALVKAGVMGVVKNTIERFSEAEKAVKGVETQVSRIERITR